MEDDPQDEGFTGMTFADTPGLFGMTLVGSFETDDSFDNESIPELTQNYSSSDDSESYESDND